MFERLLRSTVDSPQNNEKVLVSHRKRKSFHSVLALTIVVSGQISQSSAFVTTIPYSASTPCVGGRHWNTGNFEVPNRLGKARVGSLSKFHRPATSIASSFASAFQLIPISWFYLCALSIQFGVQPLLTKAYAPSGLIRSTFVMAQDLVRFFTCWLTLLLGGTWHLSIQNWSWQGALLAAGIPSVLYMVQNYFTLIAYQALPPVTFNILNQTKTLSAALCCYLILGQKQSALQIMALFLLLLSALVIENIVPLPWTKPQKTDNEALNLSPSKQGLKKEKKIAAGVIPVLIASFISGLGKRCDFDGTCSCAFYKILVLKISHTFIGYSGSRNTKEPSKFGTQCLRL